MFAGAVRVGTIDRVGIALSGLCVVHCLTSAIMLAVLASAGGFWSITASMRSAW
jgi:hypothetical protein